MNEDKIKKDLEEIETINIELDHRVLKLIAENEHLKQTYKQLYDSIKPARIRSKEQYLKDDLRKLKGKALVDNDVTKHPSDPEMLKIDVEPITLKLLNKKTAHSAYIKHTQEEAIVLRDLVEHAKSKYPLDHFLESACRYAKLIQELLTHISKTCPSVSNIDGKLVVVTLKNKDKRVRFTKPVKSSGYTITKTASTSNLVSNKTIFSFYKDKIVYYVLADHRLRSIIKKDKNRQTPSSTQKNKVEAHPRKVESSLKNKDCVVKPKGIAYMPHSKLNAILNLNMLNKVQREKFENQQERFYQYRIHLEILQVVKIVLWYLDSGCSKHMTEDRSQLTNFVNKFLGTVKFENDHVAKILGYGDYQIGNVTILRVYYVEGLGHNLFSVGQFSDSNLEVAFRQHTCFIRNLEGVDLLTGSRGNNLYTLSLGDMMTSFPICLLSKASKTNKKKPHKPKSEDTNQEKLYLLHMDLCGSMRVASVNGKSISSSLSMITLDSHGTDNGTEFVNQTLREYYEKVGISHETSVARSPQQNGVVERRNRTLIEAARTMLIYAKAPLFLWAEAVATACYTQNRSIIRLRHGKTPYELLHDKLPNLSFFHVFGALCYPTNDSENLGKLQPKADIGIFIGYAPTKKAFRIYNRRTRRIIETIHVDFDELTAMASEHSSSGPALHEMTPAIISSRLVPNPPPSTSFVPPSRSDWDLLFQPLFDELLTPPPSVDHPAPEVIAPIADVVAPEPAASTGSPSSTTVDQDAPSPSNSQTTPETQSTIIPNDVEQDYHDIEIFEIFKILNDYFTL
ncbi:retrovirus-related pol polyprotein from transposon TNT 1-94 [Tanacetum coccineum]|uniref:Retrovirus-related pol polyprotein from transposon TNT 1-94 n=1 Tax=Tanacetum coccineum TaxID=301880 RepID=A0ABQ5F183_9ASTR